MSRLNSFFSSVFTARVKGGALFVAILISIVIGVLMSLFLLIARYNQRTGLAFAQSSQLLWNLKSGFEIAQSAYFTDEMNGLWRKNTFNDDSTQVEKRAWGAFLKIVVRSKNRRAQLSESGLFGTFLPSDTALMVCDNDRPLGVSGKVVFKANCYLPKPGLKPTYIEGQSYISNANNAVFIRKAPANIPLVSPELVENLKQEQQGNNMGRDSLLYSPGGNHNNSFANKTLVWMNAPTSISQVSLKNNIKLVSGDLTIDKTCELENILIVCNKVHFKSGFVGKVHVIASDSIVCEPGCHFAYPSSFVLLTDEGENKALNYIQFSKDCRLDGGVLALTAARASTQNKVMIKLQAGCEINGLLYSDGFLHLEGQLNACAFAQKLLLKTPSAVYENHLLACELDPKKYAGFMAVPLLFKNQARLLRCQKLS